jgi:hypothetical protein
MRFNEATSANYLLGTVIASGGRRVETGTSLVSGAVMGKKRTIT